MANTTINFTIRALDGTVVPLTQFQIESGRLNTGEIPDVMPATTSFMTDANGQATVSLTVTEAPYYISKLDGTTDKVISYKFFVPESISPISGEMLYVDLGKNSKFYNDKSVAALIEAKIVAVNARNQVQLYIASNIATKLAIDAVALQVQNEHVAIQVLHDSTQAIVNTAVATINTNTAAQVANVKVITDPWLGTKSVAPTVRNDSTPLQNGDEYFDTVVMGRMAYFNGTWYVSGVSNVTNTLFSGNGITTGFVLPVDPHGINNTVVYIDSVYQQKSTYSVSGTNITFSTAPLTGTNNIDVTVAAAVVIGTLPASGVTFTPSGTLSSTNVQSAITELVTDLAASSGSSMVGYLPAGTGAVSRTVQGKLRESVSVLDFGAVGDGTGRTPADDGIDITNLSWNRYPAGSSYFDSAYTPDASITSLTKAFSNNDSWDSIGCQLAVWYSKNVYVPVGVYKLTRTIQRVRGMEGIIRGECAYQSTITYKNLSTYTSRPGSGQSLIHNYRLAGPPTYFKDIGLVGETGAIGGNGIYMQNCNQHHISDMWVAGFSVGVMQDTQCNDGPFINNIVTEFCSVAIQSTNSGLVTIAGCDFWQSAGGGLQYHAVMVYGGANTPGEVSVCNSSFVGYNGHAVNSAGFGLIGGCTVNGHLGQAVFVCGTDSVISNNVLSGNWYGAIVVGERSIVTSNGLHPGATSNHADIQLSGGSCVVSNNSVNKTNTEVVSDNYAIYVPIGTGSIISGNVLIGGVRAVISTITGNVLSNNVQNGAFSDNIPYPFTLSDGSGATLTLVKNSQETYMTIGKLVTITFDITYPLTSNTAGAVLSGLPSNSLGSSFAGAIGFTDTGLNLIMSVQNGVIGLFTTSGVLTSNASISGKRISGSATYISV